MNRPSPLLPIPAAAELLGVSRPTVYRLIANGHLPSYKVPHSRGTQVRQAEVEALIRRSQDPVVPVRGRRTRLGVPD